MIGVVSNSWNENHKSNDGFVRIAFLASNPDSKHFKEQVWARNHDWKDPSDRLPQRKCLKRWQLLTTNYKLKEDLKLTN